MAQSVYGQQRAEKARKQRAAVASRRGTRLEGHTGGIGGTPQPAPTPKTKGTATPRQSAPEGSAGVNRSRVKRTGVGDVYTKTTKNSTAGPLKRKGGLKTPGVVDHPSAQRARLSGNLKTKGVIEHPDAFMKRNPKAKIRRLANGTAVRV